MLTKNKLNTIEAATKGYTITDNGDIISPRGRILHYTISKVGYKCFKIRISGKIETIFVHRLCAYKKYGYEALLCECIRHLDGDKLNNKPDNIVLGSSKDNQLDIPKKLRLSRCNSIRKWNKTEIIDFYNKVKSYKKTMKHFGITSKGTLWFLLNK